MSINDDRNRPIAGVTDDDPDAPATITNGEVRALRRKANLGPISLIVAVVGILLALAGMYRTEWQLFPRLVKVTDEKQGAIVTKVAESESRVDVKLAKQSADLNAKVAQYDERITSAAKAANQGVYLAKQVKGELEPVTEKIELIKGEWVFLKANDARLAAADSAITTSVTQLDQKVDANQAANKEAVDTVLRQQSGIGNRLDDFDKRLSSQKKFSQAGLGLGAAGLGITLWHALDHGGREHTSTTNIAP